jgi:hypothetical protein
MMLRSRDPRYIALDLASVRFAEVTNTAFVGDHRLRVKNPAGTLGIITN